MIRFLVAVVIVVMGNIVRCSGFAFVVSTLKANRWMRKSTTVDSRSHNNVILISNWRDLKHSTQASLYGVNVSVTVKPSGNLECSHVDGVATAFVWSHESDLHPERRNDFPVGEWLATRANVGVAMSGGGMRAASCALGWLRALHHTETLQHTRYLSSNSGATWITLPLAAKELLVKMDKGVSISYDHYLGKYVPPENIRGSDTELGKMGKILNKSNVIMNDKYDPTTNFTAWVQSIDDNFVAPLKISSFPYFYKTIQDAYLVSNSTNLLNGSTFPFPIYVATAYPDKYRPGIAFPFEFTPLYAGIPMNPSRELKHKHPRIGGGYIQYHVFNSSIRDTKMPKIPKYDNSSENMYLMQFPSPVKEFNIAEITGISSSFFGAGVLMYGLREAVVNFVLRLIPFIPAHVKGFPNPTTYEYWSPESGGKSHTLGFVDGGIYDNTGVLALVRRGCKCIIACVATGAAVTDTDSDKKVLTTLSDLAALFGKEAPSKTPIMSAIASFLRGRPGLKNLSILQPPNPRPTVLKIFDENDWEPLVAKLKSKWREGAPQVVKVKVKVKKNLNASVTSDDGTSVDLIVCLNGRVKKSWYDKLGNETLKKKISPGWFGREQLGPEEMIFSPSKLLTGSVISSFLSKTKLSNQFPYYSTYRVLYDKETVNLMAHLSSFSLKTGLEAEDVHFNVCDYYE